MAAPVSASAAALPSSAKMSTRSVSKCPLSAIPRAGRTSTPNWRDPSLVSVAEKEANADLSWAIVRRVLPRASSWRIMLNRARAIRARKSSPRRTSSKEVAQLSSMTVLLNKLEEHGLADPTEPMDDESLLGHTAGEAAKRDSEALDLNIAPGQCCRPRSCSWRIGVAVGVHAGRDSSDFSGRILFTRYKKILSGMAVPAGEGARARLLSGSRRWRCRDGQWPGRVGLLRRI